MSKYFLRKLLIIYFAIIVAASISFIREDNCYNLRLVQSLEVTRKIKTPSINPEIFRAYDIRGIADRDLPDGVVYQIGRAYATFLKRNLAKENITVGVGRDVRTSSPRIQKSFIKGLLDSGINVIDLGITSTPLACLSVPLYDLDGAVNITASHLPPEFNGIKPTIGIRSLSSEEIQELKSIIQDAEFSEREGTLTAIDPNSDYKKIIESSARLTGDSWYNLIKEKGLKGAIEKTKDLDTQAFKGLKIVIDAGNGTTGRNAVEIFRNLGAEVIGINIEPDGTFPAHIPDPTVLEYVVQLVQKAKEEGADLGIGYDADGDRVGIVTPDGKLIEGDMLLAILSKPVLELHPGSYVVFDAKSSQGLIDFIEQNGGKPVMWKTGPPNIRSKMAELGEEAFIGGEVACHMYFLENFRIDDGIFATAKLLRQMVDTGKGIGELLADVPKYFSTPEIRTAGPSSIQERITIIEKVSTYFKELGYKVIDVDGARIVFEDLDGWALIRTSNTESKFILRAESKTKAGLDEIWEKFIEVVKQYYPQLDVSEEN